jgi:hypothetical protein
LLALVALTLMVFCSSGRIHVFGASESDAVAAIAVAEEKIIVCYQAVAEADSVGADVTALLNVLDEAGQLLSKAELSYDVGNFDSAVDFATQSQDGLDGFFVEAKALTEKAVQERYWDMLITFGGSIVGTILVIFGSFVCWRFLKRRYGGGDAV